MTIPSIPTVPLCRTKEILELPKEELVRRTYQVIITYTEQREMSFIESIFSALFLWFDPNYFTVKKSFQDVLTLDNEKLGSIRFKVIPTDSTEESIKIEKATCSIFLGQNMQAESVKYTIRDNLLSPVLQTNSYNIPYDSDSIEVQNFAEVITDSFNLSHSYTATDIEFMKEHVIPTLLTARDVLLMKSKYSRRLGEGSSLPSKEFVISTKIVPGHESKSIKLDTSSLEPTSFIRRRLEAGDVFSVKLKADGTFLFSNPTEPIPLGGLKKVKLKIIIRQTEQTRSI